MATKTVAARTRGLTKPAAQKTKKTESKPSKPSQPATQTLQSAIQSWLDNGLKTVSPAEKRKLFDAAWPEIEAMGLSAETILSNKQAIDLQKLLGKYGANYLLKKPTPATATKPAAAQTQPATTKTPATKPAATKPAATQQPVATKPVAEQKPATKPATTKPVSTGRQNLTFNDLLKDLGLTGKESADSAALKKVQDWLKARPGYKPGAKTNAYIKQLSEQPTAPVSKAPAKPAEPTDIAQVAGYAGAGKQRQAIKSGKTNKPKNWQYDEASGWVDMHGERHNYTKDYDPKGVWAKQHNTNVSDIAKIVSSGR